MPWIDPIEHYAKPPRPVIAPVASDEWAGETEEGPDGGLIEGFAVKGGVIEAAENLSIVDSVLSGVDVSTKRGSSVEISESHVRNCDLSGVRLRTLRSVTVSGSRLSGANLSEGSITDVVFDTCTFQYANLRRAKLERVGFVRCKLEESDFSGAKLSDVTFEESDLLMVDLLDGFFERVDLRGARSLSIASDGRLAGCLISDAQVQELAYGLALRAGASIERAES